MYQALNEKKKHIMVIQGSFYIVKFFKKNFDWQHVHYSIMYNEMTVSTPNTRLMNELHTFLENHL